MNRDLRGALSSPADPIHAVTYWTGIWEPGREGISKEVAWLRRRLAPRATVVSFTPQSSRPLFRDRVLRLNLKRWLWLRATAFALEEKTVVNHVFGGLATARHFLLVLRRRPILFTAVIPGETFEPTLYARVAHFVAESRDLASSLAGVGVPSDRIDIIYPAVDIDRHAVPAAPVGERFRLLFASTPSDPGEIDSRGLGLLIELARLRPDIDVVVAWRRWGRVGECVRRIESRQPPPNFLLQQGDLADMTTLYQRVHATVCGFEAGFGKSAPNSIVEGLAAGRPALVTDTCGIADLIGEWQAGVVTVRSAEALARGVDDLRQRYDAASAQARRLAEQEFDERKALARYAALYRRLASMPRL